MKIRRPGAHHRTTQAVSMRLLGCAVAALVLVAGAAFASDGEEATSDETSPRSLASPFRSLEQTQTILDQLALELAVEHGYTAVPSESSLPGIEALVRLERIVDGETGFIQVATGRHPAGHYQIYLTGQGADDELEEAGTKLAAIVDQVRKARLKPGAERLALEVFQLSYVPSDRALALLRALGYSVIDYNAEDSGREEKYRFIPDTILGMLASDDDDETEDGESIRLPAIVRMLDSDETSLLDPGLSSSSGEYDEMAGLAGATAVPDIGGTFLHDTTSAEPQERLLIVYDSAEPQAALRLIQFLREEIDVPSRQIVVEALVVEVDLQKLRDIGVEFNSVGGDSNLSFGSRATQFFAPWVYNFDKNGQGQSPSVLNVTLSALVENGDAEILSNPSVLVLDGRQARIQIGQQIPVVTSSANLGVITGGVTYFPVGIVLNLRPRVNADATQVSMQVETIVSAISQTAGLNVTDDTGVPIVAPVVDNRQVQTFVRVSNNTPFIIGGLIASELRDTISGVPGLSKIPGLGALFRRKKKEKFDREVIVVLTPHIVPRDQRNFSYLIPRPSSIFDSVGHRLFRNAYRISDDDVFDLSFVLDSAYLAALRNEAQQLATANPETASDPTVAKLLAGDVPGEEILVRRMLWEIVRKTDFGRFVSPERILFFKSGNGDGIQPGYDPTLLSAELAKRDASSNALVLEYAAPAEVSIDHPFVRPIPNISFETVSGDTYARRLRLGNQRGIDGSISNASLVLSTSYSGIREPVQLLSEVIVLDRILRLNPELSLTLSGFYAGQEIVFPTEEELLNSFHVIDRHVARMFYEVSMYYEAFEEHFKIQAKEVQQLSQD